jgi:hypothetical protein
MMKVLKLVIFIDIDKEMQGILKVGKIYESRSARNVVTELLNVCHLY